MSYVSRLPLAVLLFLGGIVPAHAASSVPIKGKMETICFVQVKQTNTNSIDLTKGATSLAVATVGEKCNLSNGFKISITSANAGSLVDTAGNKVPYTIRYDNSGTRALTTATVLTRTAAQRTVSTKTFSVTVPAKTNAIAGSYADTITVSIAAR